MSLIKGNEQLQSFKEDERENRQKALQDSAGLSTGAGLTGISEGKGHMKKFTLVSYISENISDDERTFLLFITIP